MSGVYHEAGAASCRLCCGLLQRRSHHFSTRGARRVFHRLGVQALYRLSLSKDSEIRRQLRQIGEQREQIQNLARSVATKDARIDALAAQNREQARQVQEMRQAQEQMALVVERLARAQGETRIAEASRP